MKKAHRIIAALAGRFFKPLGLEVRFAPPSALAPGSPTCLVPDLGRLFPSIQRRSTSPTFVQVGAFDGVTNDPIFPLVRDHGIGGLVIEPQPQIFKQLCQNYQPYPNVHCENLAIAATSGMVKLYGLKPEAIAKHHMALQIASLRREVLAQHRRYWPDIDDYIVEMQVPAQPLADVVRKHGFSRVDILWVDTEGHDYNVLRTFDFERFRPSVIGFEHKHLSVAEWNTCLNWLVGMGYQVADLGSGDTIAAL